MYEILIDLFDSLESGYFKTDNKEQWEQGLNAIGIDTQDIKGFVKTLDKVISLKNYVQEAQPAGGYPIRIYNEEELQRLDPTCRGLLLRFQYEGLLPPELRELVITQIMRMSEIVFDETKLRLLVLLVLFHQDSLDVILSHYKTLASLQGAVIH